VKRAQTVMSRWSRTVIAAAVVALAAAGLLASCARVPAAAACSQYQYSAGSTVNPDEPFAGRFGLLVILLDLPANSPQTASMIDTDLHPYLQAAVAQGDFVKIEADGGEGTQLQGSPCFDGTQPFLVTRANQVAQQKSQAAAVNALDSMLKSFVESVKVSPRGSASRLLHQAPDQVSGLRAGAPDPVGPAQVILWSNLLGNSTESDCLNLNGVPGTPAYASAIARRCFSEHQLTPLSGAALDIIGVGAGAVNDQQSLLAGDLADALCREYVSCRQSPA